MVPGNKAASTPAELEAQDMKRGAPDHPKFRLLASELGLKRYRVVGVMESLYHFAAAYAKRGDIGKWSNQEIASQIEWDGDADDLINALVLVGLVDESPSYRLLIHDWPEHADQTVKRSEEVQKYGFAVETASNLLANASSCQQSASKNYPGIDPCFTAEPKPKPKPEPTPTPKPKPAPLGSRDGTGRDGEKFNTGRGEQDPIAGIVPDACLCWEEAKVRANWCLQQLGLRAPEKRADRSLVLKAAALVSLGRMPEAWFAESVEAVKVSNPKRPWAYLQQCLSNRAKEAKKDIGAMLATVTVPEDLLNHKKKAE